MSSDVTAVPAEGDGTPAAGTADGAAEMALGEALGTLAGLDAAIGLRHVRGRRDSYVRLLRKFAETRAADIEAMHASLAADDFVQLSAIAHNVKGVAGFLGAVDVQALAAEVTAAVRAGRDAAEVRRCAAALIEAQSELCGAVLALAAPPPAPDA